MAAPVISSQQLSSYAITTDGSTTASGTFTNSDQVIAYIVDNKISYPLTNTSGDSWSRELRGWEIGIGSAMTVTFIASNDDPDGTEADAGSTLTVTAPDKPTPVEMQVIDAFVRELREMDTTNDDFGSIKKVFDKLPKEHDLENKENLPACWPRVLNATPTERYAGGEALKFDPLVIEFDFFNSFTETSSSDWFYYVRQAFTDLNERNRYLKLSDETYQVEKWEVGQITYPKFIGETFIPLMTISVLVTVNLEGG